MQPNDILLAALREWKCPSCGGSGKYHQNRKDAERKAERGVPLDPQFNPGAVGCKICGGDGLHPTASAAIREAADG